MNPYAPPKTHLEDIAIPRNGRTAIFIAAAIGYGIAYAVLSVFGLVFLWILVGQGVPTEELYTRAYQSTGYLLFAHLVSVLCLIPGGYWSARLSSKNPFLNAFWAGSLVLLFSMTTNLLPYELPIPLWSDIASVLIPVPAFLLGAFWWQREALTANSDA